MFELKMTQPLDDETNQNDDPNLDQLDIHH